MVTVSAAVRMPLPPAPSDAAVGKHRDAGKKPAAYGAAAGVLQLIYQLGRTAAPPVLPAVSPVELRCHPCLQILHRIRRRVERHPSPYSDPALAPIHGRAWNTSQFRREKVTAGALV
jgi:hypothetical protein